MTKIEWTDKTWNPIVGCSKVSEGCRNCYAEKMACRQVCMGNHNYYGVVMPLLSTPKGWNGRTAFVKSALEKPLHWKKPRRIFVCSMGDLFHPSVHFEQIDKVIAVAVVCYHHIFQFLTKHEDRMAEYFKQAGLFSEIIPNATHKYLHHRGIQEPAPAYFAFNCFEAEYKAPIPNLWLGVTCENQTWMDNRATELIFNINAAKKFISFEPLLGEIFPRKYLGDIDWVIIGCESGPYRRPCKIEWVRNLVGQCKAANVPVFVKQLSINGKVSHNPAEWPDDLRIREFPK